MEAPAGDPQRVKLLLDEMWSPGIAEALRERGHDATAVAERPELRGQPDEVIFREALGQDWVIVTENVADYRLLAADALRAGLRAPACIYTSNRAWPRANPGTAGRLIVALDALLSDRAAIEGEYWLD